MPEGVVKPRLRVWGQVKIEHDDKLIYQSPPEEVRVSGLIHELYERARARYCMLTRDQEIPSYYRTGCLPPGSMILALIRLEISLNNRRIRTWLRGLHLPMCSM